MLRVLIPVIVLGAAVYAVIDCFQTAGDRVRSLPKALWILLIVVAPVIGPIAWFTVGRPQRPTAGPRRAGPQGPDDDPDFLRGL